MYENILCFHTYVKRDGFQIPFFFHHPSPFIAQPVFFICFFMLTPDLDLGNVIAQMLSRGMEFNIILCYL